MVSTRLAVEVEACAEHLTLRRAEASTELLVPIVRRFGAFVVATSTATRLREVSPADAERFLNSRTSFGLPARSSTMHNRRNALRALFAAARALGLADGDPTLDSQLPARNAIAARPLTSSEIECGRRAALGLAVPRHRLVWALAEATARGCELARVTWGDVDLSAGTVGLAGSSRVRARNAQLTGWGHDVLSALAADRVGPVVGGGGSGARVQAAAALSAVLVRAGLAGLPGVRPASVAAWAGRTLMDAEGDIAAVARLLGVGSLDTAARAIGWEWREQ